VALLLLSTNSAAIDRGADVTLHSSKPAAAAAWQANDGTDRRTDA